MNCEESPLEPPPYLETAHAVMARAIGTARQVAESDVPILISGESGTGKHVLAQAIHRWSACPGAPFLALPRIGFADHRDEGTLSPRTEPKAPADETFEPIHGGTLFCEEVGDL